jgi:hypothetical protein
MREKRERKRENVCVGRKIRGREEKKQGKHPF